MRWFETKVRVRYAETDQMRVVYHANYLIWFEVGRVEAIRAMGLDYSALEREEGVGIAVADVSVRYKIPARYDEELVVRTRLVGARGSIVRFGYELRRLQDGVLLAEGATVHVVVGRDMKRARLPARYAGVFSGVLEASSVGLEG